ncbi:hypothetical protein D3C72_1850060 [compost metagenome]
MGMGDAIAGILIVVVSPADRQIQLLLAFEIGLSHRKSDDVSVGGHGFHRRLHGRYDQDGVVYSALMHERAKAIRVPSRVGRFLPKASVPGRRPFKNHYAEHGNSV